MVKFIEFLTEHCRKRYGFRKNDELEINADSVSYHLYFKQKRVFSIKVETVICKEFCFIKRLIENDKINRTQIPNGIKEIGIPMMINGKIGYGFDSLDYYWLLMLLAIQDEPIRFLCEILK